jgi:hypothetical protein
MYPSPSRLLALVCLTLLLGACDASPPNAPAVGEDALLAAASPGLSAPSALSATAEGPSWITVTWQDGSTKESGYEVHRSSTGETGTFALIATTGENATSHTEWGVPGDTRHCYKVRAFRRTPGKTTYAGFSIVACARTPLQTPSIVNAGPASSSSVSVAWSDHSATEDGFRLERAETSAGHWSAVLTTAANVTTHLDPDRATEQQVCYRVIAFNAHGESAPSNVDCTVPPAAPSGLVATATQTTIELVWTDNSAAEEAYVLERANEESLGFFVLAVLPTSSTVFSDQFTWLDNTFSYRVRARRDGGYSDYSEVVTAVRSCTRAETGEICDNGIDDDCDETIDGYDEDCGAMPCDWGCPPGYACYGDGYCYPWIQSEDVSSLCTESSCQLPGGRP